MIEKLEQPAIGAMIVFERDRPPFGVAQFRDPVRNVAEAAVRVAQHEARSESATPFDCHGARGIAIRRRIAVHVNPGSAESVAGGESIQRVT